MKNLGMENAQDMGIPVWMCTRRCVCRKYHHITIGTRVQGVLSSADIICCVIDAEDLRRIDSVVVNTDCVVVSI